MRLDARRGMETADLPLERVPAVCTTLCTAAYVRDNVPLLQRYIVERVAPAAGAAGDSSSATAAVLGAAGHRGPQPSGNGEAAAQTPRAAAAAGVTLEAALRAAERLEAAGLKVLDMGLMTQVARYIDGPLLPGPRIQVLAANIAAWKTEQVCPFCYMCLCAAFTFVSCTTSSACSRDTCLYTRHTFESCKSEVRSG